MFDALPVQALAEPLLFAGFLVMLRIVGVTIALPALGSGTFGGPTRMLVVTFMTVYMYSALGMPFVPIPELPATALMLFVREFMLGAGMGLFLRVLFAIADVSGAIAGMAMSLSMAGMVDPATGEQTTAIANMLSIGAMLIFVALGGHYEVIKGLFANFHAWPIGASSLIALDLDGLSQLGHGLFGAALQISAPVIIVTTLVNVGLGLMARAAPQVNIFAVGFSVLLIVGLILLDTTAVALHESFEDRVPTLAEDMNMYLRHLDTGRLGAS